MTGIKGGKKRFWSLEEKYSICNQARAAGVSVAQVARRYSMNANLIHKWLRDPRFATSDNRLPDTGPDMGPDMGLELEATRSFLPIEIEDAIPSSNEPAVVSSANIPASAQRIDITLSDGRRILVEGPTPLTTVITLVEGLMR